MITVEKLRSRSACYFNVTRCSLPCGICKQQEETLAWLGDGKTLRQIAKNKNIPLMDRLWVFDTFAPYSSANDRSPEWDQFGVEEDLFCCIEKYLGIRVFQLADKADQ